MPVSTLGSCLQWAWQGQGRAITSPAPVPHRSPNARTAHRPHRPAVDALCPAVAPRTSGRRTVMHWHTESVVDPRTGATVTEVQPGTFCTQVCGCAGGGGEASAGSAPRS